MAQFDPFNNRLCRDIRNDLSSALTLALQTGNTVSLDRVRTNYLRPDLPEHCRVYILERAARYQEVLNQVEQRKVEGLYPIAFALWDQGLFFEVHEYLEKTWYHAEGREKEILQAMIRAAGTYVHLEQGNLTGARKMSLKAIKALERLKSFLPSCFDQELLLSSLRNLDPEPPKLARISPQDL